MRQSSGVRDELLKVEPQSGHLRQVLWLILIFIIWSLLAYISSSVNPLPALPSLVSFFNLESSSLATDLWEDILGNYFSGFTLLNLALFILLSLNSFAAAVQLLRRALHLSDKKAAQRYLRSCLFSRPDYPQLNLSEPDFQKSDEWKILASIGGPCFLQVGTTDAVLVNGLNDFAQICFPSPDEDSMVFIHQGEKVSHIFPVDTLLFNLTIHAIDKASQSITWRNLRLSCGLSIPSDGIISEDSFPLEALHQFLDSGVQGWKDNLHEILSLEISTYLLNYTTNELRQVFDIKNPITAQTNRLKPESHQTHKVAHHRRLYPIPGSYFNWQKQGGFLRRRRRSLLPELRHFLIIERTPEPPIPDFKAKLNDYLTRIFKSIYNIPINIEIENIGEIKFNGEN